MKQPIDGNCLRLTLKGVLFSEGVNDNLRIKNFLPILLSDITLPSMTYVPNFVIINRVPLHNPKDCSMFLSNITGTPIFNLSL
jgi:hypothetical protein